MGFIIIYAFGFLIIWVQFYLCPSAKNLLVLHPPFERRLEMKTANIEIFKNLNGTLTIKDDGFIRNGSVSFPIELTPTIIEMLQMVYTQNRGKSDIIPDEEDNDE